MARAGPSSRLGLFLVLLKDRPAAARGIRAAGSRQRSWMAREAWVANGVVPLGALAAWYDTPDWLVAAAIVGLLFLYSQAMILREAKGIPGPGAYRSSRALIVTTALPRVLGAA